MGEANFSKAQGVVDLIKRQGEQECVLVSSDCGGLVMMLLLILFLLLLLLLILLLLLLLLIILLLLLLQVATHTINHKQ